MACFTGYLQLTSWIVHEAKYMMLSMMISSLKQPGNEINVYLSPLIEDLKLMWD